MLKITLTEKIKMKLLLTLQTLASDALLLSAIENKTAHGFPQINTHIHTYFSLTL